MSHLNLPYQNELVNLIDVNQKHYLKKQSANLLDWDLTARQVCDLELLLNGAFSPLQGFMSEADYLSVVTNMALSNGVLWPLPICLDITDEFAKKITLGDSIALRDPEGVVLAILEINSKWMPDKEVEAQKVFGTTDEVHPAVDYLFNKAGDWYLGGHIKGIELPTHYDYKALRDTPKQLRDKFEKVGWQNIVAFQTRNPLHKAHQELTFRAAKDAQANLLIHPVVGMTKPGDIDHYSRVRCYEHVLKYYPEQTTALSLLPMAMRMAGPREALLHAIIRKNYGCSHIIIGRDHAGPGKNSEGKDFYGPYDAQELFKKHQSELGIKMIPFQKVSYVPEKSEYLPSNEISPEMATEDISGTELKRRLRQGLEIPTWFSYPEVIKELRKTKPARHKQGFTVFFTGLSGSGKSTIANALLVKLLEMGDRPVTLLDGDIVRKNLSSELGFSKEHRNLNIERIGFVASEITKNRGIAICAPIAPYEKTRRQVRELINGYGGYIEVFVNTPLEECERRDRKGLYAKARAGIIKEFTGISDPYEIPDEPELVIPTLETSPDNAAHKVILKLEQLGYIK
ncbi:bifunctional sulfate adenylyltransferase/adenylylsulfate kinase [Kangiella sp. HZ709]|uniref:bifunctional sulfate adenylyltransferase/adenylylsulfate kinase n=1 Tax=Kangiella sp. HZ709 TaxID=2666328 RepID=UPI0012AF4FFF|nr:bifunctional sulfate adenylyltransferase/adenylylsulfate kinase [Kangiella sp. HZ709]MRX27139.1 bifunctional sulfate adenylyltransferase/adenylylsulfate kinase [Kangiella sp. HZ709]